MKELSQLFHNIFATREVKPTNVQTALEPFREKESNEGGEFLDDFSTMDDQPEDQLVAPSE
jgi:hypothetical protein